MAGQFLVGALQVRLVAIRARDPNLRVVGYQDRRGRAIKLQRPHVARESVRQRLAARGLRVDTAARAHRTDKQMRPERLLAARPVDRHRTPSVIDKQLLAGEVPLAHRALQALLPGTVDLAERAAAVGRRAEATGGTLPP